MADPIDLDAFRRGIDEIRHEKDALLSGPAALGLKSGGGDGTSGGMGMLTYRMDQFERRAQDADARMARIEDKLGSIQVTLAGLATRDNLRNWAIGVVAIVIATGLTVGALLLQSSGNQLAAFQSGLSAIQAVTAAAHVAPAPAPAPVRPAPVTKPPG